MADDHGVRLAILETRMEQYAQDMAELKSDVRTILDKFNQMTGGKKALLALSAMLGFVIGAAGNIASALLGRH